MISELKNKILKDIIVEKRDFITRENDIIKFITDDSEVYFMTHFQDCCEDVCIDDINGDFKDLLNTPILVAEERTNGDETEYGSETWTFYELRTIKGSVNIRWYGSSNGYYSESVNVYKETNYE